MHLTLSKEFLYFVSNILENIFQIIVAFSLNEMIRIYDYTFDRRS